MRNDAVTPEDLAQIAAIVDAAEQRITRNAQEALDRTTQAIREEISTGDARTVEAIREEISRGDARTIEAIREEISTGDARTIEAMRDMQSEILRGIEAFARGNFARMVRLEHADAAT